MFGGSKTDKFSCVPAEWYLFTVLVSCLHYRIHNDKMGTFPIVLFPSLFFIYVLYIHIYINIVTVFVLRE